MNKFDNVEHEVFAAFSDVRVNTQGLAERVIGRMGEKNRGKSIRVIRMVPLMAALVLTLALSATVFAFGGFERFMERFNPNFGSIVEPFMIYHEEQGIRMTVIGAQRFDNVAIIYLSLQDVSGGNRLAKLPDLTQPFRIGINWDMADDRAGRVVSTRQNMLYFDESTNTAYYEIYVAAEAGTPLADPLEIGIGQLFFGAVRYTEPLALAFREIGTEETVPVAEGYIFGRSTQFVTWDELPPLGFVLAPGFYAPMPHGDERQWISNAGIINGQIRVQIVNLHEVETFGPTDPHLFIVTQGEEHIPHTQAAHIYMDEGFNFFCMSRFGLGDWPAYILHEFIFDIGIDIGNLANYTVMYSGTVSDGIAGEWRVEVNTGNTETGMIAFTNDVPAGGILFEFMTLTPLGLTTAVRYEYDGVFTPRTFVEMETVYGIVALNDWLMTYRGGTHHFTWRSKSPLDISTVTAIIVNGLRIPIP